MCAGLTEEQHSSQGLRNVLSVRSTSSKLNRSSLKFDTDAKKEPPQLCIINAAKFSQFTQFLTKHSAELTLPTDITDIRERA